MSRIDRLKPTAFLGRRTLQPFVVPVYQYSSPPFPVRGHVGVNLRRTLGRHIYLVKLT